MSNKHVRYAISALASLMVFVLFFGTGIYYFGWHGSAVAAIARVMPYPAILVDWEAVPFHTYADDFQTLNKYWNYQRGNTNVLLGIPDEEEIRERLVNKLIAEQIVKIYARKNGIMVLDEELYLEWERLKQKQGGEEEIAQFLDGAYGWTDKKFITRVLHPFLLQQKVKMSLIKDAQKEDNDLRERALELYVLAAENGSDFAALAKEHSDDEGSYLSGGDLGYFGRGAMDPYFEEAIFSMKIGEVSEPVKSSFGYHIIKLEDLLYNDLDVATQARARHILIKGFDFDEWLEEQKKRAAIFRLVL